MALMRKRHRPREEEDERGRKDEPYGGYKFQNGLMIVCRGKAAYPLGVPKVNIATGQPERWLGLDEGSAMWTAASLRTIDEYDRRPSRRASS